MMTNHYMGMIVRREFPNRIYLDELEYSLQKSIYQDFQGRNITIEFWITKHPMDYFQLADDLGTEITSENKDYFSMYSFFNTIGRKDTLLNFFGNTEYINSRVGEYMYIVVKALS